MLARALRQPVAVGGGEVHHEAHHRKRLEWQAADAEPAHLDEPGELSR